MPWKKLLEKQPQQHSNSLHIPSYLSFLMPNGLKFLDFCPFLSENGGLPLTSVTASLCVTASCSEDPWSASATSSTARWSEQWVTSQSHALRTLVLGKVQQSHFIVEGTETQRVEVKCPWPTSHFVAESSVLCHLCEDCLRASGKHAINHKLLQASDMHKEVT